MALTATAQPVPPRPWDEQIVPALRKRLEAESRMLTKRMSMISTHSDDDGAGSGSGSYQSLSAMPSMGPPPPRAPRVDQARQSPVATRPSAIPRPSGQYSRKDLAAAPSDDRPTTPSSRQPQQAHAGPGRPKRSRTLSTPGLHNTSGMPTPASSRSNSPMVAMNPKPSRIPTPATPKGSSAASPSVPQVPRLPNNVRSKTFAAGQHPPSPETSPDLFPASQARQDVRAAANSSHSSFEHPYPSSPMHTKLSSELMREPPPFESVGRLSFSNDEGERPFEHWYRGEARRNGGVGEVRVARQDEMLEIATYGHRLGASPPSSSSYANTSFTGRRRAGTIGNRESWFMDDDALRTMQSGGVLDEQPLTDIDTANELSEFDVSSPNSNAATPRYPPIGLPGQQQQEANQSWDGLELDRRPSAMSLAASQRSQQIQQQQQQLGYGRASPASPAMAGRASPAVPGRASPAMPRQLSNNSLQVNTVTANNNAARPRKASTPMSPAQQIASSAHRGRNAAGNRSAQHARNKQQQQQKPRSKSTPGLGNSSPTAGSGGDEIIEYEMDAIPVWTQPKHNGNWDDVVLPAVAKKMGISDGYEEFDGSSPRPARKRESSERVAPAPGTFGFDDSKYRRPQPLELDEFGRRDRSDPESGKGHQTSGESEEERQQTEPILRPISPGTLRRGRATADPPPSPAPFASYQQRPLQPPRTASQPSMLQPPAVVSPPPPERFVLEKQREEKEDEGGCCRCTIM